MHRKVIKIIQRQRRLLGAVLFVALSLSLLGACGGGMSEDEKAVAVAIGLTQTAAAIGEEATTATVAPPETPAPPTVGVTATVASELPSPPTAEATVAAAAQPTAVPAQPTPAIDALAAGATLPTTQNSLKVRTLLVAPGEPGVLYALLTDAADGTAPVAGAQLLTSTDFGASWSPAPSGLPVEADCLLNLNMDYYGATALYASTCEGIYRWAADSESWSLVSPEQTGMVAVVYGSADLIWATKPYGTAGAPLIISQNGGESWTEVNTTHTNGVANIGISPRDSQSGYAIVWPGGEGSYLRRGTIFTDWQIMPAPQGGLPVNTGMTIDGGTGWLYVTTTEAAGDRLWRSTDADTPIIDDVGWSEVYRFAPGDQVELLASGWSSTEDQLAIYANLRREVNGQPQYILIRSLDGGQSWAPLVINAG